MYFGFPANNGRIIVQDKKSRKEVICKLCLKAIKYSGNTTNLRFHLKEHHRRTYLSLPADKVVAHEKPSPQQTIVQSITATQKIPTASPKWNKLTNSVSYFTAKDMQPLDTIDDIGFRHLLQTFEPPTFKKIIDNQISTTIVC